MKEAFQLSDYSVAQREILCDRGDRKQIIAAAGSGKTRTVVGYIRKKILTENLPADKILLLSFSRKAVMELKSRIIGGAPFTEGRSSGDGVCVSTFHAFCLRELSRRNGGKGRSPVITPQIKKKFFVDRLRKNPAIGAIPFDVILDNMPRFRKLFPEVAMEIGRDFYDFKRKTGGLEFDDMIERVIEGLDCGTLKELKDRFELIVVDEFQDTDPRQMEFLRLMNSREILTVGDDYQAIYSFRGASLEPFFNFRSQFDAKVFYLQENYRSIHSIVQGGEKAIGKSKKQMKKKVVAVRGKEPRLPLLSMYVEPGKESQAAAILRNREDFVILCRTNFRIEIWKRAGVPERNLLTIHRAKGLEFPVVFLDLIAGWTGSAPVEMDEEIRVLYVGITRARNLGVVLHSRKASNTLEAVFSEGIFLPITREITGREMPGWLSRESELRAGND